MQFDEIKMKYVDKLINGMRWLEGQLSQDPQVMAQSDRAKVAMRKLINTTLDEWDEFFADPEDDPRHDLDDTDIFGDDDIAVGPGRTTATGFMDPPDDEEDDDDDEEDFDTGNDYDDGFSS